MYVDISCIYLYMYSVSQGYTSIVTALNWLFGSSVLQFLQQYTHAFIKRFGSMPSQNYNMKLDHQFMNIN